MSGRIIGIDVARALAVIGMIIVNFKIVFGENGAEILKGIAYLFEGKAAATFGVLAGVGIALMSKSALQTTEIDKLKKIKIGIRNRAIFLFVIGLSYIAIWPADILHFYGIYMLITLVLLSSASRTILISASLLILLYPFLMIFFNYETGWDFATLEYQNFWSLSGFFRNLLYNGFHPVVPWAAFMLIGFWFGKKKIHDNQFVKRSLWVSLTVFIATQLLSWAMIVLLSQGSPVIKNQLLLIIGTSPMPPLPIYMLSGSSIAIFIISGSILLSNKYNGNKIIDALCKTGQLALTFYVAHVIIGMGIVEAINPQKMGKYSIEFSLSYALFFSLFCILFAIIWRKRKAMGPLEWVMRRITAVTLR